MRLLFDQSEVQNANSEFRLFAREHKEYELISAGGLGCPEISADVASVANGLISRFRFWIPGSREIIFAEAVRDDSVLYSGPRDGMLIAFQIGRVIDLTVE